MYQTMRLFLSIFLMLFFTSCSFKHKATIPQTNKNIDALIDDNLKKMSLTDSSDIVMVLLPLSGANAHLGQGILNACILAAKESQSSNVRFVVVDTADRSLDKNRMAQKSYQRKKVKAIIGPVFFTEARRFGALFTNVPIFTFSNNIKVNSKHIFACGLSPQDEINEICSFAIKKRLNGFLLMLPKGAYGDEIAKYFKTSLKKFGFDDEDDIDVIRYSSMDKDSATKYAKNTGKNAVFIIDPILDLDRLPDNVKVFTLSAHALQDREAWQGCIFAFSDIQELEHFSEKYKATFGRMPTVLDVIGYDITNAIIASSNDLEEPFVLDGKKFDGCLGEFSIVKNKGVKRKLNLYKDKRDTDEEASEKDENKNEQDEEDKSYDEDE